MSNVQGSRDNFLLAGTKLDDGWPCVLICEAALTRTIHEFACKSVSVDREKVYILEKKTVYSAIVTRSVSEESRLN